MIQVEHIREGWRMFLRHLRVRGKNFETFRGSPQQICEKILKRLWNGGFFETGLGNHTEFYSRDFGMMVPSLLSLGLHDQVRMTLRYALEIYATQGKITTQITPRKKAISFPNVYSPDSVAYFLRSLRLLNDKALITKYRGFLQSEVDRFRKVALGEDMLIRRHTHFSGMRDHAIRDASCYDTVMAAVVQREAKLLGLDYPIHLDYAKVLKEKYWRKTAFVDDRSSDIITADANIFPFWLDVIGDKKMLKAALTHMRRIGLDKPFPVKYVSSEKERGRMIWLERFVRSWEVNTIWPMSGLPFIELVARIDKQKASAYVEKYAQIIKKHRTFLEVYHSSGQPYKSFFYSCDEGMIWCSLLLTLQKKHGK